MSQALHQGGGLMGPGSLNGLQVLSEDRFKPEHDDLSASVTFSGGKEHYHRDWKTLAYRALAKVLTRRYGDHRPLNGSYQKRGEDFWFVGRVFNAVYSQHSGPGQDLSNDDFVISEKFGTTFYIKPRPFVVIKADRYLVTALMVTSYDGQGSDKQYVNSHDLGSLYTCENDNEEPDPSSRGVGFMYSKRSRPWKDESHIHYGHVVTFDSSIPVEDLGTVATGSMQKFMNQARIGIFPAMTVMRPQPPPYQGPARRSQQYGHQRYHHRPHPDEYHNRFRRDEHGPPRQHGGQRSHYRPHPDETHNGLRRVGHGPYGI